MAKHIVYARTNPLIKQYIVWGEHETKSEAEKHRKASARAHPDKEFIVSTPNKMKSVNEENTTLEGE